MSEKIPPQPSEEKKTSPFSFVTNLLEKVRQRNKHIEAETNLAEAKELTNWAFLQFISAEVKAPQKTFSPNQYQDSLKLSDLTTKQSSVVMMEGTLRRRNEHHFWFVLVKVRDEYYMTNIVTSGIDMPMLEPRIEGVSLGETHKLDAKHVSQTFPIQFAIQFFYDQPLDMELGETDRVNVMFAGTPEKNNATQVKANERELGLVGQAST
jgi:hypothetical protein